MYHHHHLQPILSSLFRLATYVFLRVIPTTLAKPVLPILYLSHILAIHFFPPRPRKRTTAPLTVLVLSLPTHSRSLNVANILINSLLLLAAADLALAPFFDPAHHLSFSRVGAVYPDAAKILVRAPFQNNSLHILYRDTTTPQLPWIHGPAVDLLPQNDWAHTVRLDNLWPSTPYEC